MSPRVDSGLTLLLFALVFTGELAAAVGLFTLGVWIGKWSHARFVRGAAELTARCDALQRRYDPAEVDYGDDVMAVADSLRDDEPARLAFSLRDRMWARRAGLDLDSEAQR